MFGLDGMNKNMATSSRSVVGTHTEFFGLFFVLGIPKKDMYYFMQWVKKSWEFPKMLVHFWNCLGNSQKLLDIR